MMERGNVVESQRSSQHESRPGSAMAQTPCLMLITCIGPRGDSTVVRNTASADRNIGAARSSSDDAPARPAEQDRLFAVEYKPVFLRLRFVDVVRGPFRNVAKHVKHP